MMVYWYWSISYFIKLGIRGAKGAPLPRMCFAQLALAVLSYYLCYEQCYVHTEGQTDTHNYQISYSVLSIDMIGQLL